MVEQSPSGGRPAGRPAADPAVRDELARHEEPEEGEQLAHDRLLVDGLRAEGFAGPRFGQFYEIIFGGLVSVSWGTLYGWMGPSGQIWVECERIGRPVGRKWHGPLTHAEREDLASLTVEAAEPLFLDRGLRGGGWDPARKTTLQTYFTGTCKLQFPDVYRKWEGDRLRAGELLTQREVESGGLARWKQRAPSIEDRVARRDLIEWAFEHMPDPKVQGAVRRQGTGATAKAAAEAEGLTAKQLEMRLTRWRKKYGQEGEGW